MIINKGARTRQCKHAKSQIECNVSYITLCRFVRFASYCIAIDSWEISFRWCARLLELAGVYHFHSHMQVIACTVALALLIVIVNEQRVLRRSPRTYSNRILERAVAWETCDRVADATITMKLRHDGLPLRCAAGWVCDASGATGLEDTDGDSCA